MLDKKTSDVLSMLATQVGYNYKVVQKQQLVDSLPKKCALNWEELGSVIAFLKENEYLVVKYQDRDEMCLSLTTKAETYLAGEREAAPKSKIAGGQASLLLLGVFLAAFLGALAANFIGLLF